MANDVADRALCRKTIFMSVSNVRCSLHLDSFHFRLRRGDREMSLFVIGSSQTNVMCPDHLS